VRSHLHAQAASLRRKQPCCPLDRKVGGPQSPSGRCGGNKNILPRPAIEAPMPWAGIPHILLLAGSQHVSGRSRDRPSGRRFPWFSCLQMVRMFQVAIACFSCSPPDSNSSELRPDVEKILDPTGTGTPTLRSFGPQPVAMPTTLSRYPCSPSSATVKNAWSCTSTPTYVSMAWCLME
jgi:hypothetical protein